MSGVKDFITYLRQPVETKVVKVDTAWSKLPPVLSMDREILTVEL